jgi:hypothetical protein
VEFCRRCAILYCGILSYCCWICCFWTLCTPSTSTYLPTCLSICLFMYLPVYMSISLCNRSHLSEVLLTYLSASLSIYRYLNLSIYVYLSSFLCITIVIIAVIKILTYFQSERFLFIIFYNLVFKLSIIVKAVVLNPYIHVLCSFWLLCSLSIPRHLYFCLFTSFELICFLSPMLGIMMIFVVSFVNARTLRSYFQIIT